MQLSGTPAVPPALAHGPVPSVLYGYRRHWRAARFRK